jgi:hypothetical protein
MSFGVFLNGANLDAFFDLGNGTESDEELAINTWPQRSSSSASSILRPAADREEN